MDWEVIAPMIVGIVLILTIGGVTLLRPLAKRLGDLLELMAEERRSGDVTAGFDQIRELLERQNSRLELLERRQDFTESLLASRQQSAVEPPGTPKVLPGEQA